MGKEGRVGEGVRKRVAAQLDELLMIHACLKQVKKKVETKGTKSSPGHIAHQNREALRAGGAREAWCGEGEAG